MKRLDPNNCIITFPENDPAPAVVFYGGLLGWQGNWFLANKKIPDALLKSVYFVLPTLFTNKCKDCLDEFRANVDPKNVTQLSLCGFSRGAQEVYRNKDLEKWKILGLVDPSAPTLDIFKDDVLDTFQDKIRCVFWVPNWGKDGYKGRVPKFANHLRDDLELVKNGKMLEKATPHQDMPTLFFQTFRAELVP